MSTAFLFPGQASQKVGMGYDLYTNTKLGKLYFDRANEIMGMDIQDIVFNGPEEQLKQTQYTQPAIYIISVILGELLLKLGFKPTVAAGHSLGEYSALTIAGAFNFDIGLRLVKFRAKSMQKAGEEIPGTMAAIIGLRDENIQNLCRQCSNNGVVVTANYNAPGQTVISGDVAEVQLVMERSKEAGALRVVALNVSGAFHSPLMLPAREALAEKLKSIEIRDATLPVYSNVTAQPVFNAEEIRQRLIRQLMNPVLWHQTITNMHENGIKKFTEVGPGRILQGLNRRIDRRLVTKGVETLNDVNQYEYV